MSCISDSFPFFYSASYHTSNNQTCSQLPHTSSCFADCSCSLHHTSCWSSHRDALSFSSPDTKISSPHKFFLTRLISKSPCSRFPVASLWLAFQQIPRTHTLSHMDASSRLKHLLKCLPIKRIPSICNLFPHLDSCVHYTRGIQTLSSTGGTDNRNQTNNPQNQDYDVNECFKTYCPIGLHISFAHPPLEPV